VTPRFSGCDPANTQDRLIQGAGDGRRFVPLSGPSQDVQRDSFCQAGTRMPFANSRTPGFVGISSIVLAGAESKVLKSATRRVVTTMTDHHAVRDSAVRQLPYDYMNPAGLVLNGNGAVAAIKPWASPNEAVAFSYPSSFDSNIDRSVAAAPTTKLAGGMAWTTVIAAATDRANRIMFSLHRVALSPGAAPSVNTDNAMDIACQLYPILALGRDPLATNERLPDELPAHNPLCDARQSARLLIEALRECDARSAL
jgi:hypothetical protein